MIRQLANQYVLLGGIVAIVLSSLLFMTTVAGSTATKEPNIRIATGVPPRITSMSVGGAGVQGRFDYDLFPSLSLAPTNMLDNTSTIGVESQIETKSPILLEDNSSLEVEPALRIPGSMNMSQVAWQSTAMSTVIPSLLNVIQEDVVALNEKETTHPSSEPTPEEVTTKNTATIGTANRIAVPSIGIDIGVQPGLYDISTGSWTLSDNSAFHADTTVPVNNSNGTTLIYGHAKWGIFGSLPDTPPGAEASVYASDGLRFVYTLESVRQVDPSDVSMLTSRGAPKLILQTCSGFFDQYRTLATFRFKEIAYV